MLGNRAIFGRKGLGGPPAIAEVLAALSPPAGYESAPAKTAQPKPAKPRKARATRKSQPKGRKSDDV